MSNIKYSYETLGKSSYLVTTFEGGKGLINYQLQMLVNNEIKNIIKANKRQNNDDILISYNITSKISLEQLGNKNKISKIGVINIIEGALAALEDIEEYQLVSSGIVFDEKYIYVKPDTYEPSFIYLPCSTEECGLEPIRSLLLSLIMGSKVEMSNDNFVQTLLDTINKPGLSTNDLKKLCENFKNKGSGNSYKESNNKQQPVKQVEIPVAPKVEIPQPVPVVRQEPKPPVSIPDNNAGNSGTEKQRDVSTPDKKEKAPKAKTIIFSLLQVVFLGALAAVLLSGILKTENGELNIQYLLGVVLIIAAADFIIYREMFKNNKADKGKTENKNQKSPKMPNGPMPNGPMVSIPGKSEPVKPAVPKMEAPNPPVQPASDPVQPEPRPVAYEVPRPAVIPPKPNYDQVGYESEDTVVLDDVNTVEAYLEYFDNGLSTKIRLDKDNVIVGKLRGQCDFVINNNKISKIHAEFITRGTEHFVKDYNSTNGTYINGASQRISSNTEYPIYNGDKITLANVEMTFRC